MFTKVIGKGGKREKRRVSKGGEEDGNGVGEGGRGVVGW